MIKKIFPNELDLFNMSLKKTVPEPPQKKVDYRGFVVDKPWGYEYLMFENSHVAIWVLFLKNESKTSIHCHPKKKTSLLVLDGSVKTSSLDSVFSLQSMEGVIIDRGVFHSTHAVSEHGAFVMEVETPVEKSDLVRLKDEYGRENLGYENRNSFSFDIEKYEYCDFHNESEEKEEVEKLIKNKTMKIYRLDTFDVVYEKVKKHHTKTLCPLNYKLVDSEGKVIVDVGDIISVQDLPGDTLFSQPEKGLVSLLIG